MASGETSDIYAYKATQLKQFSGTVHLGRLNSLDRGWHQSIQEQLDQTKRPSRLVAIQMPLERLQAGQAASN